MKRRAWLLSGAGAAGALLVGWSLLPQRSRLGRADALPPTEGEVGLNGWIKIKRDGTVLLAMNRSEMGQGVHTALAMLVAEELDVPLPSVQLIAAGHDTLYGNVVASVSDLLPLHTRQREPGHETRTARAANWMFGKVARELGINATGGSASVADAWDVLPLAAATARAQLLGAASLWWKQPVGELSVSKGVVHHLATEREAHYGELAKRAAATPPGEVRRKQRADWKLVGTAAPRIDAAGKADGSAVFGIDARPPGLVYAVVRHCPMLGGSPGRVGVDAAMKLPGVERVVRLGSWAGSTPGLAVVGRSSWHALRGAQALEVAWQAPPGGTLDSRQIAQALEQSARAAAQADGGVAFHSRGTARAVLDGAARRIERVYHAPFLAHATMEPINCTARVAEGRVEVWAPTQVPGLARALAAHVAGVDETAVTVHVTYLGGGFGRRLEIDHVGQAVRVALETGGRPVQLLWPREEDIGHDFYRPAAAVVMQAGLDAQGRPLALHITSAGDTLLPGYTRRCVPALAGLVRQLPDKLASEGLFDLPYAVPHQRIAHLAVPTGVPVGHWRAVGHSQNAFFAECFIDELAHEAGQDPVAFRLGLLQALPRHTAVLRLAADKADWGRPAPPGRARGVALLACYGSVVAEVVEASWVGGRPRVHRVVCAADIGTVVNPGIVAQQMESAVIFGLSAALYGRIDIEASVVRQSNFPNHPLLTLAETPRIETHLVASTRPPGGVGEVGLPPLAPALANALFALTGKRIRSLPLMPG